MQNQFELADVRAIIDPIVKLDSDKLDAMRQNFVDAQDSLTKMQRELDDMNGKLHTLHDESERRAGIITKLEKEAKAKDQLCMQAKEIVDKFTKAASLFTTLPTKDATSSGDSETPKDTEGQSVSA